MTTNQKPQSARTIFLDQPPSCLQFCPASPDYLVVGTYLLSETKDEEENIHQNKTGSLQLWKLDAAENTLSLIQRISLPYAVFDFHFHPRDPTLLAIASSAGSVAFFKVSTPESQPPEITELFIQSVHEDPSIPALFLAWAPQNWCQQEDAFAVTFSDGRTTVFGSKGQNSRLSDAKGAVELGQFQARQLIEVWFVALAALYERSEPDSAIPFMFTGNDFGSLHTCRFDMNATENQADDESNTLPLLLDHDDRARHHTAGVTSILPLPLPLLDGASLLVTGSYDENLRVYHATNRGQVLAEIGLGGGVWRLQLLSVENSSVLSMNNTTDEWGFVVLASCMHAGTRIVRITNRGAEWEMEILAEFTEHESMNYASDAWKGTGGKKSEQVCVSTSFYDRRMCIWRAKV